MEPSGDAVFVAPQCTVPTASTKRACRISTPFRTAGRLGEPIGVRRAGDRWRRPSRPAAHRAEGTARKLLARRNDGVQFVGPLEADGAKIFAHACRLGLEGIVSKRADSPHRAGPSRVWLKIKNRNHPSIERI